LLQTKPVKFQELKMAVAESGIRTSPHLNFQQSQQNIVLGTQKSRRSDDRQI
jgi:hypothetical protein